MIKARQKAGEKEDFHIGGSDASGIVYKVGKDVKNVKVGDEVVIHCATWDRNDPWVKAGNDPMYAPPSASGATKPTTAASLSSPGCRRTSACRSRST